MGTRRGLGSAAALILVLALSGCFGSPPPVPSALRPPVAAAATTPSLVQSTYPVGLRVLRLRRGPDRPLPTLVFYPVATPPAEWPGSGDGTGRMAGARHPAAEVLRDGDPAPGRFPLVVFSHGLRGSPESFATALTRWAAAGFVVAAPTFPRTNADAKPYRRRDIVNQPDDVRHVLARLRGLSAKDPLHGHLDMNRIAAVGHSAGGYTTTGLFVAGHDPRLRAGLILAGWQAPGAFAGPAANMLFLQGTNDPVVPPAKSRAAYANVPWPKAYVLMPGISHADYLHPGQLGYAQVETTALDFLRWTLKADAAAGRRLPPMVRPGSIA